MSYNVIIEGLLSGSSENSAKLLVADVDIIDSTTCNGLLSSSCNRNWCGLDEHQMCAGKLTGGVDTCRVIIRQNIIICLAINHILSN